MSRLIVFFTSFVFLFVLGVGEADARRFGGGGSKGTFSRQMAPSKAPSQTQAQQSKTSAAKPAVAANTGRGFGGMLMGLAAGGLLAALFMGGAFDGIQFFDIILIALVVGGVIYFLRSRRIQQQSQSAAYAFTSNSQESVEPVSQSPDSHTPLSTEASRVPDDESIIYGAPSWFDEKTFLEGARTHFLDLQKAWDINDLSTIEEYVTPQLYKFLKEERAAELDHVDTKVHKLAVEITNIQQLPSNVVELSIMFHGVINEGEPMDSQFCETWHLIRDMNHDNSPWLIQGIEEIES